MKQLSTTQLQLLDFLADGQCYSGNSLGDRLTMTRSAVWKHIEQLRDWGIAIHRIAGQGYQLAAPLILLNEQKIRNALAKTPFNKALQLHLSTEINSTNLKLKELIPTTALAVCCAEKQTQGRGRFGRHWVSPFGENIYFSAGWQWQGCLSRLSGLSLVVSLAVLACLKDQGIEHDILVKWPNDVLWQQKKLAGILVEINAESHGNAQIIIGIGINVNTDTQKQQLPDKPWCSLYEITGHYFDRNHLIASLIYRLDDYMNQFFLQGFAGFHHHWQAVDFLKEKFITLAQINHSLSGKACGVNKQGQLQVIDNHGNLHAISSGEASLVGSR